ncbi:MAG: Asp-tRNA(Asn)/Glu-tRNA(Gln) amidotransferase subunit GatC [Planctomycetota bacterium]
MDEPASRAGELSEADVRRVARLSRLSVSEDEIEGVRTRLGAVLGYVERLGELDLEGEEPMAHAGDEVNRLRGDEPSEGLSNKTLMDMAPEVLAPFVRVPKVLGGGDGGGTGGGGS